MAFEEKANHVFDHVEDKLEFNGHDRPRGVPYYMERAGESGKIDNRREKRTF